MEQEETVTAPAEPTPAPIEITMDQIVASIINLNQRLALIESFHKAAIRKASQVYRGGLVRP